MNCGQWKKLVIRGMEAETKKRDPKLGVKQKPWWPVIPLSNYMTPLLHCEIGIGNQLLEKLHDIINKYIESYPSGEESIRSSIPVLKQIITDTAKQRDEWDESVNKKNRKTLMKTVATYCKLYSRRGREMTACCRIRKLNCCVCIFVRCLFCGMEHFRWHGL